MLIYSTPSIARLEALHDAFMEKGEVVRSATDALNRCRERQAQVWAQIEAHRQNGGGQKRTVLDREYEAAHQDVLAAIRRLGRAERAAELPTRLWALARDYAARNMSLESLPSELREAVQ